MSLIAAVGEWEARQQADETRPETLVKHAKQAFHRGASCSGPMKHAEPQNSAISNPCFTVSSPRARNSETSLPASVVDGLGKLRSGWRPSSVDPKLWRVIVADALRLSDDEWGEQALALGWSVSDLWGLNDRRQGLAIWLDGRRTVLLDERSVIVADGDRRCQFNRCRHGMPGAKMLWEI